MTVLKYCKIIGDILSRWISLCKQVSDEEHV